MQIDITLCRRTLLLLCAGITCVIVFSLVVRVLFFDSSPTRSTLDEVTQSLHAARGHLRSGNWKQAREIAERILQVTPADPQALLIAGEAATRQGEFSASIAYYARIGDQHAQAFLTATLAVAEVYRVTGQLEQAERFYRKALERDPSLSVAIDRLALILKLTGRHWTARPMLFNVLEQEVAHVELLQWLADPRRPLEGSDLLASSLETDPNQPFVKLGLADLKIARGELADAENLLRDARQQRPGDAEIEAAWGRCLFEQRRLQELEAWWQTLPETVLAHPDVWYIAGALFEELGQSNPACRYYLESLQRDQDHSAAAHRLGQLLVKLERLEQAEPLLERSRELEELAAVTSSTTRQAPSMEVCRRVSMKLESLGRLWEAVAWTTLGRNQAPYADWAVTTLQRLLPRLDSTRAADRLQIPVDLPKLAEEFPLLGRTSSALDAQLLSEAPQPIVPMSTVPVFTNETSTTGIDFTYFESPDPHTEGRRLFEFTGGGVAVLDFDLDGWPDLYFTQGAEMPPGRSEKEWLDQLYRNLGDGRFDSVTSFAGIIEERFSQGASAGDFNNDGFQDLYVANLGENRLFENMGDGTFLEVSQGRLPGDDQWTTSCAIADVNLDGIPDFVDINYLQGPGLLERICSTPAGPRVCSPYAFEGAMDRLILGDGTGGGSEHSVSSGFNRPNGKGLGLLIGDLTNDGQVEIFVANDTVANFLYENQAVPGDPPRFRETALQAGTAFSQDGQPQACMGIAAADFNGHGQQDLFVTNYFNESNALYINQGGGLFGDEARAANLRKPSLPMLGFGTQAIDVELDGDLDLVVLNGDLDDFTHAGRPMRMRAQLFLNDGDARFVERQSESSSDYFSPTAVSRGRALAKLDWNRDGLEDFVATHLDEPVSLVTNRTQRQGEFIAIRCVGTNSSRDAIGLRLQVWSETGKRPQTFWLNAGDGYQACNERQVIVGLKHGSGDVSIEVSWPRGHVQKFRNVDRNTWSLCVEGQPALLPLMRPTQPE